MNLQARIWTEKITRIVADYKRLSAACDAAEKAGCLDINGPLFEAIWKSHELLIKQCDSDGWLSWFIYDNDCGEKKMEAKFYGGQLRPITTPAQLARLILKIQSTP